MSRGLLSSLLLFLVLLAGAPAQAEEPPEPGELGERHCSGAVYLY